MKPIRSWIVVADGAQARIFENDGPGKGLTALPGESWERALPPSREIASDRPGRTHDRQGPGRHAMEPSTDPHRDEKWNFAKDLADHLNGAAKQQHFDRLILVAPAKTLGDLRQALGKQASERITGELSKDLTSVPARDLPGHLGEVMPV